MPIEVHCPNPDCARVHLVKNKYAGMRGRCPDCANWMYVPRLGMMPSAVVERPEALAEAAPRSKAAAEPPARPARAAKAEAVSLADVDLGPPPDDAPPKKKPKPRPRDVEEDEVLAEADDEAPAKEKKPFNKFAIVLIVLSILTLGAMCAVPLLPGPSRTASGYFEKNMSLKPEGVPEDKVLFVAAAPGPIILILLLSLLMGLALREWGFLSIALVYIASVLVAGLAFFAAYALQRDLVTMSEVRTRVEAEKNKERDDGKKIEGDYTATMGLQLPVASGAVGATAVLLLLAAMLMHRRWWARVVCFFVLLTPLALVSVWNFRKELGIEAYVPTF